MKKYNFVSDYGDVECKYFFDIDSGYDGTDIYLNGEWVGDMFDANIPDDYDEEETFAEFEDKINEWLNDNI